MILRTGKLMLRCMNHGKKCYFTYTAHNVRLPWNIAFFPQNYLLKEQYILPLSLHRHLNQVVNFFGGWVSTITTLKGLVSKLDKNIYILVSRWTWVLFFERVWELMICNWCPVSVTESCLFLAIYLLTIPFPIT